VLAADEVVAAAPARAVPELAALALADGVPAEDHVPAPDEPDGDLLVAGVGLAHRRVAARQEHRRSLPRRALGHVHEGGHADAGQALEDELLDPIAFHRDRARDARVKRRPLPGQPADHGEDLAPQLVLKGTQVGLRLHPGETFLPCGVEGPRALDLVREVRRDARALGRRLEHPEHLGRGHLRGASRSREACGQEARHPEEPHPGRATRDPPRLRVPRDTARRSPSG
jgi:hypothetical protein